MKQQINTKQSASRGAAQEHTTPPASGATAASKAALQVPLPGHANPGHAIQLQRRGCHVLQLAPQLVHLASRVAGPRQRQVLATWAAVQVEATRLQLVGVLESRERGTDMLVLLKEVCCAWRGQRAVVENRQEAPGSRLSPDCHSPGRQGRNGSMCTSREVSPPLPSPFFFCSQPPHTYHQARFLMHCLAQPPLEPSRGRTCRQR